MSRCSRVHQWAAFAVTCAVVQLAPLARRAFGWSDEQAWTAAAVGAGGLAAWWALVVLPFVTTNVGFVLSAAVGMAAGALLVTPGRRR